MVKRGVYAAERRGVKAASHVVVVSEPMKDHVVEEWKVPRKKVSVIPNGYPKEEVEPFENIEPVPGQVGFIGTLHPKLDIEQFVAVAESPHVDSVRIVGDGPARDDILELSQRRGVADIVEAPGQLPQDEAFTTLAESEVVLYPIEKTLHTEMLVSRKIFDYAALGKAMVLSDVSESDVWARFADENAALLTEPENDDFVQKVNQLLTDDESRESMGRSASELAPEFSWGRQSKDLLELYNENDLIYE
jgi:glycosyltransferase involved in cell wall biosynthesis